MWQFYNWIRHSNCKTNNYINNKDGKFQNSWSQLSWGSWGNSYIEVLFIPGISHRHYLIIIFAFSKLQWSIQFQKLLLHTKCTNSEKCIQSKLNLGVRCPLAIQDKSKTNALFLREHWQLRQIRESPREFCRDKSWEWPSGEPSLKNWISSAERWWVKPDIYRPNQRIYIHNFINTEE